MSYVMQITSHPLAPGTPNGYTTVALTSVNKRWKQAQLLLFTSLKNYIKYGIVQTEVMMSSEQSEHERQWRDYRTANGARPIRDFFLALPDEDRAAILEEMENIREHGRSVARHLRGDIYEVRATYNAKAYRILFACEGYFNHILLSLEGFQKKTQQTPETNIKLAEQRLADWRRRGKAKRASQENERRN